MMDIRDLSCGYGKHPVVRRASLRVARGGVHAIVGPSGAGKTTLLRAVAGLERPLAGTISLDGRLVAGDGAWVGPEKRGVGLVFQSLALWPHMSVAAHLSFAMGGRPGARVKDESIRRILDSTRLSGLEARMPGTLSGGERQRLAIARALASGPRYLLMDEPFSHLDEPLRCELLAFARSLPDREGVTLLYVTHNVDEALGIADGISVLRQGEIVKTWDRTGLVSMDKEMILRCF